MMVGKCVSSKSNTLAAMVLSAAAVRISMRWLRPITVACGAHENFPYMRAAFSIVGSKDADKATEKKLSNERLASCLTCSGISCQLQVCTKSARMAEGPDVACVESVLFESLMCSLSLKD
jgi:hypothetical protein